MRTVFAVSVALLLSAVPLHGQKSVVEKYRALYPTPLGAENTVKLLRQVAAEVHGGLLVKTSGSNCLGYSCDIVCFSPTNQVDVLVDAENAARPTWSVLDPTSVVARPCEMVTAPPPPPPPPPGDDLAKEIEKLRGSLTGMSDHVAELNATIRAQNETIGALRDAVLALPSCQPTFTWPNYRLKSPWFGIGTFVLKPDPPTSGGR